MITLFDYQQEALNLMIEAFRTKAAALVVMATGLGKTIVAAFWAKEELKHKRRGLFLCHEKGILDQAFVEFRKILGESCSLKTFYGDKKDWRSDEADIVFASFQTLVESNVFFENEFDFIIVDESHHGQAPTFKKVIQYFKPKKLLGITATPDRMDLKDIRDIFGEEVVNYTLEEAMAKGWLTQVEYHILNDNLNHWKLKKIFRDVLEVGKRVSIKQLNESIFIKKRDEEIARTIQEYAGMSKKTIIFCEKIEHAENFQKYLPGSLTYHSEVENKDKENPKRLDAFRRGSLQYILAVDKFNEGIDVPDAELIVFLRCTNSKTIFFQQLGRGLRKIFGKEKVIVLDFVANCKRLVMVKEMAIRVKEFAGNHFMLSKELLHISGAAFDFIFSDEQVGILEVIRAINCRYVIDFPNLLAEYSSQNSLSPEKAHAGSHSKYLWECLKCNHKWWAQGRSRLIQKNGCPACAGKVPKPSEYLSITNPELAKLYSDKNEVSFGTISDRNILDRYFWKCSRCKNDFEETLFAVIAKLESGRLVCPDCIAKQEQTKEKRRRERGAGYYQFSRDAIEASIKLGIIDWRSYCKLRKADPKLPFAPNSFYSNCDGCFFEKLKEAIKKK